MKKWLILVTVLGVLVLGIVCWGILDWVRTGGPADLIAVMRPEVDLEPLQSGFEAQSQTINALVGSVESQGEQLGDLVETVDNLVELSEATQTPWIIEVPVTVTEVITQVITTTPKPSANTPVPHAPTATSDSVAAARPGISTVSLVFKASDSLNYPNLVAPDYSRQSVFPDVPNGTRPALVAYELPFEDGDYFEDGHGDIDLPQYYYRVMTAGRIMIDQLGVDCTASETKGCAAILINHFGPTAMFRNALVDNGFTIAGRVFDMNSPELTTLAGQALLDHYMGRMTQVADGANCGVISACVQVEWHVVVVGNNTLQVHWTGLYSR